SSSKDAQPRSTARPFQIAAISSPRSSRNGSRSGCGNSSVELPSLDPFSPTVRIRLGEEPGRAAADAPCPGKYLKEVAMGAIWTIGLVFAFCGSALALTEDVRERCDNPFRNLAAAIKACTAIIDTLDNGYVLDAAYLHRGIAYLRKGNFDSAIADFSEAIN